MSSFRAVSTARMTSRTVWIQDPVLIAGSALATIDSGRVKTLHYRTPSVDSHGALAGRRAPRSEPAASEPSETEALPPAAAGSLLVECPSTNGCPEVSAAIRHHGWYRPLGNRWNLSPARFLGTAAGTVRSPPWSVEADRDRQAGRVDPGKSWPTRYRRRPRVADPGIVAIAKTGASARDFHRRNATPGPAAGIQFPAVSLAVLLARIAPAKCGGVGRQLLTRPCIPGLWQSNDDQSSAGSRMFVDAN